jgi:hypothetical protein
MHYRTLAAAAALAAVAGLAVAALAHDGVNDAWMGSLKSPVTGISCCDLTDCFITRARIGKDGWEAQNQRGQWVVIPEDIIIRDKGNPTGEPVLCFNYNRPLCYVPPPMG